ncbi:MAG: hypothetical protein ACYCUM_11750 [Solirubrobacteraceae bacterium]
MDCRTAGRGMRRLGTRKHAAAARRGRGERRSRPWLLLALTLAALSAGAAPALAAEGEGQGFGIEKWEAGTCSTVNCTDTGPSEYFYTQAAGHPQFGITDFRINTKQEGTTGAHVPEGHVQDVRVDLPPGLAVDPEAAEECSEAALKGSKCPAGSQVGEDEATGTVKVTGTVAKKIEEILPIVKGVPVPGAPGFESLTVTEHFKVFNMERRYGEPARFGVEVKSETLKLAGIEADIYIEGGLSWYAEPAGAAGSETYGVRTGDYHEYFKIPNIPEAPEVVESKLIFWGRPHEHNPAAPEKTFITMPSECNGPQTTLLHISSYEDPGHFSFKENPTPVGATGCATLPDAPKIEQKPETTAADAPDGTTVTLRVPQGTTSPSTPNSPTVKQAVVTLPEGMTLNPSAANGLQACPSIGIGTNAPIDCPAGSVIGTVNVDAPGIPNGSLTGSVYLGTPKAKATQNRGEAESGEEYRIFIAAEAPAYGVGVRLEGRVSANEETGRLTSTFSNLPNVPFEAFELHFNGGAKAPLANPLLCGQASTAATVSPSSGEAPALTTFPFPVVPAGGGACTAPPFAPGQGTSSSSSAAGASPSFTLGLSRPEGEQYLSQVSTELPIGLVGEIAKVPLCEEGQAAAGACPAASAIGAASVAIGSGPAPYGLSGTVYLTGPYDGAPFGLSIVVPASSVGPFDFGDIVTRAAISIDPYTTRVTVASTLPSIVGGAPVRLRAVNVTIDRPGFLVNPTSCGALSTNSTFVSVFGARSAASTPFQASACGALAFKPKLTARTKGRTSHRAGASLRVTVTAPEHEANIREVRVTLPKKLVARLNTLNHACLLATFDANPDACPKQSKVGTASVRTPVLPGKLSGIAYFVSLGHAGFPNLDFVLEGDGVRVILVGSTNIRGKYTHSNFTSVPDVPFSAFTVTLPEGRNSALSANGNLCQDARRLRMPTSLVAQDGARLTEKARIDVTGCGHRKHRKHRKHRGRRGHGRAHRRRSGAHRRRHASGRPRRHGRPHGGRG